MAPRVNTKPKKAGMLKAVTEALSNQFHSIQKTRTSGRLLAKKTHAVVASNDDVDMDHLAVAGSAPSKRGRAASVAIKKTLTAVATKLKSAGRRKEKMGDMMIIDPPQAPNLHGQPVSISPNSSRTLVNQINITHGYYSNHSSTIPSLTPSPGPSHELEIDLSPLTTAPPTSDEEDEEMQDAQDEGFNSITAWRFALTAPPPKFYPPLTPRAPMFSSPLTTPPSTAPPTPPPMRKSLKIRVKNPTYVLPTVIRSRASLRVPSMISVESSRRDQKRGRKENSEDDTEGLPKKRLKRSHESTTQPANLSDMSVTLDVMGEEPTPPLATDDDDCSVPQVTTSPDVTNAVTGPLSTPGKKSAKATKREIKALPKRQGTGSKKRGPCIVCGLDRGTKWKREDGTKKDICHGCFERALNRDRVKETTAQEDDTASRNMLPVAIGPASTVSAPSNTVEAPLSQSTRAGMDGKVVETMAPRDASTGQAKRAAAAQPPPILSAPLEADDFGNQPTKSTMTYISSFLGKRKAKAPARYGGAIEDASILARLGEEDDVAEYGRQAKKPKTRDTSLKFIINFEKQTVERKSLQTEEQKPASKASNPRSPREKTKPTAVESRAPPADQIVGNHDVGLHLQATRCKAAALKDYQNLACTSCIQKQFAKDDCRFIHVRWFNYAMVSEVREHPTSKSGGSKPTTVQVLKAVKGPFFLSNTEEDAELRWRSQWNIDFTPANIKPLKTTISNNLIPVLERELEHAAQEGAIRRAKDVTHRRSCDGCLTSIFSGTYLCKNCGREYCSKCCSELRAGDKRNVKCQAPKYHQEQHNFENFIPVTEFSISELQAHILEMKKESAAASLGMPSTTAVDPDTIVEVAADATSKSTWSPPVDPSGVASLPVHEFHHTQLDEETFRKIWARGEPLVVSGVLDKAQLQWTPQYFTEKHGTAACTIVDCDDDKAKLIPSTVAEFFNDFGHYDGRATILKLKDWPPTSEFSQSFPDEYKDFHRFVPMPNYTRRDGVLNLASNWPVNAVAPDIGPKMYSALESKETPGGKGSTRLHKDMADAVNVMTYAAPKDGREGCAAWDIFRAEDSEKIRQFLREEMSCEDMDGIHAQCFYLDSALRKKLFDKCGVKSWRIYQRTGDAVFIPAGCAHQVCNLADTIKIAVDFVSPQNVDRCAQLTTEFRAMNKKRKWKEDVLSLESTMWYAWLSCQTQEKRLEKGKGRASD